MAIDDEYRTADEGYETAANSSNLKVDVNRRGSVDYLISAGWSHGRLGMALLRLHSEYCAVADSMKPAFVPTFEDILARLPLVVLRVEKGQDGAPRSVRGPDVQGATVRLAEALAEAERARANELRLKAVALRSRRAVWEHLQPWVLSRGIDQEVAAEALLYWLTSVCPACSGRQYKLIPGAPVLGERQCDKCGGRGHSPEPAGTEPVLDHIRVCLSSARQALRRNLSNMRQSRKEREGG